MKLILGDCLEVMAGMELASVDAIVTDPPYGLGFMGKRWDSLPPGPETAEAMFRVLKPAHYLLAFGGTRTHHRLMVALEDAGFEIRDTLMWLYGSGFPKGKGNLKPAWEPIILCRKPGAKVRPLGIDECRIGTEPVVSLKGLGNNRNLNDDGWKGIGHVPEPTTNIGRWPANLILDETSGAMLDEQSGQTAAGHFPARRAGIGYQSGALGQEGLEARSTDSGGASRFFYCPKASRAERNAGCEGLERKVYAPSGGAQGAAARSEEYDKGQGIGLNRVSMRQNHHPTVKPVALMAWLVRLIAPPSATVLDPFMGSGTTGVAAVQEGREFIGIEREPEYLAIAEARIKNATRQGVLL